MNFTAERWNSKNGEKTKTRKGDDNGIQISKDMLKETYIFFLGDCYTFALTES